MPFVALIRVPLFPVEFSDHLLRDRLERLENAISIYRDRLDGGPGVAIELLVHIGNGHGVGHITLVELQDQRKILNVEAVLLQVLGQIVERIDILLLQVRVGIGNEDHAIATLQDQLARGIIIDLTGHGIELKLRPHARHGTQIEGQEVEVQGAIGLGGDGDQFARRICGSFGVHDLQVGGLSTTPGTVKDDFAVHFPGGKIDLNHETCRPLP